MRIARPTGLRKRFASAIRSRSRDSRALRRPLQQPTAGCWREHRIDAGHRNLDESAIARASAIERWSAARERTRSSRRGGAQGSEPLVRRRRSRHSRSCRAATASGDAVARDPCARCACRLPDAGAAGRRCLRFPGVTRGIPLAAEEFIAAERFNADRPSTAPTWRLLRERVRWWWPRRNTGRRCDWMHVSFRPGRSCRPDAAAGSRNRAESILREGSSCRRRTRRCITRSACRWSAAARARGAARAQARDGSRSAQRALRVRVRSAVGAGADATKR